MTRRYHRTFLLATCLAGLLALSFAFPSPTAAQVSKANSFAQGKTMASAQGAVLLVFVHGSDWNALSEQIFRTQWPDSFNSLKSIGRFVLTDVDVLQSPDKNQTIRNDKRNEGWPADRYSLPAIVAFGPDGEKYGARQRLDLYGQGINTVAVISEFAEACQHRLQTQRSLTEARQQSNTQEEIRLLFELVSQPLDHPHIDQKHLHEIDPAQKYDTAALSLPGLYDLVQQAIRDAQSDAADEAEGRLKSRLDNTGLTTEQRGRVSLALAAFYQKREGFSKEAESWFRQTAEQYPEIEPGIVAKQMYDLNYGPPSLSGGWAPRHCSVDEPQTQTIDGLTAPIEPGDYRLRFQYQRGKSALSIQAVRLYDGNALIAKDVHDGHAGTNHDANEYQLHVERRVNEPRLEFDSSTGPDNDSYGEISWSKE